MTGDGKDMTVDITFNPDEMTPDRWIIHLAIRGRKR